MIEGGLNLERALRKQLRGEVHFDAATRGRYSTDASIYQITPLGVILPRDDEDLLLALQIARECDTPVLARGAGSSQCGQTVGDALIVDVSRHMHGIGELDAAACRITVEPGVVLDQLNAFLKPHGLFYPVDVSTSAQATLGGMAGNNSCGSRSLHYGNMVHNVESISVVMADGASVDFGPDSSSTDMRAAAIEHSFREIARRHQYDIRSHVPKMLRRVGGYNIDLLDCQSPMPYRADGALNLAQLLIGSEGTLAFTRRLSLRLAALPKARVLGVVNFKSLAEAMQTTAAIVALKPVAVELVDRTMIDLAMSNPAFAPVISRALLNQPDALLLVEFAGESAALLRPRLDELADLLSGYFNDQRLVRIEQDTEQKALWEVRKAGLNIMMSMKGDGKPVSFIEDCAVPLEHLAEYTASLSEVFTRHGTSGTWYAHASVGTLHVRPILDMRRDGATKMRAIAEEASALVRRFKGAYSGEHGDGLCRGEWIGWQFGPELCKGFLDIKRLFDPAGRYAPKKMLDAPRMDDARNFRFAPQYRVIPLLPRLDWSGFNVTRDPVTGKEGSPNSAGDPSHGLAMAVEMCNNNGHCRKFDAGTMCPSYRISRNEAHVTRGRANTLRLAMSGQLGEHGLASQEVKDALDLCVSCKGCKRECPTGVDMARIKIEARAAFNARAGLSFRDHVIAALPQSLPRLTGNAWLPALANHFGKTALLSRAIGFTTRRAPPKLRHSFLARTARVADDRADVVLWVDTFNNHFEPEVLQAALEVLKASGARVAIAGHDQTRPLCCGRTYLAAGAVIQAQIEARRSLEALLPFLKQGAVIVGLEPSCLFTLKDEWQGLGLGKDGALAGERAMLLEEYLLQDGVRQRLAAQLTPSSGDVLVHGHCHQKAFDAFSPTIRVLEMIAGLKVKAIESSCCGMAGSFGLEAEHYDASIAMAELALAPAIRKAPDAEIVADGTSCRSQVAHTTGRAALHVAVLLQRNLGRL